MTDISKLAKHWLRLGTQRALKSEELRWTVGAGAIGSAAALALGVTSVGVAGAFGAIPIAGVILVGVPAALVGNRIGIEIEKRALRKAAREGAEPEVL